MQYLENCEGSSSQGAWVLSSDRDGIVHWPVTEVDMMGDTRDIDSVTDF